jgi:serine/threonine-protein kinase HipA
MIKEKKCLFCYEDLKDSEIEFHQKCSEKIFGSRKITFLDISFNEIEKLASESINRSLAVPGVQKKLSLELNKDKKNPRLTIVGYKGNYILKPPSNEYKELPENEDLTMHLAQIAGIVTSIHSLIRFKSGELAYITKRFDRENNHKIPVEDMNQLSGNLTADKYHGSVERVSKLINQYCTYNVLEVIKFYKLLVFCFITGNADMHLKNFSIMTEPDGHIKLSPAYDLLSTKLVIPEDNEESALTINGKKRNISINDLKISANTMNIEEKAQLKIFSDIKNSIPIMTSFIKKSFLSEDMKKEYIDLIEEKIKILNL